MLAERLGNLVGNVGDSKQMSPDGKQCRACCNLDSVLTTGYLSYLNECREVNLYIQLGVLDRDGSMVIPIDPCCWIMGNRSRFLSTRP